MLSDNFDKALNICKDLIGNKQTATEQEISESISNTKLIFKDVDFDSIKLELQACYNTPIDCYEILEGRDRREPWLREYKSEVTPYSWEFWNRYKIYLDKDKHYSKGVIYQLDDLTDKILDKLFNPQRHEIVIDKEGMVVGQVQSGKTANYTGLICKAADAGFNLIIVLAGIHNNLRSQTQLRLDEGFLGFDTQTERVFSNNRSNKIGVGCYPSYVHAIAHSITTSREDGDFTKKAGDTLGINFNTCEPILIVVKKNVSVLKRLYAWLKAHCTGDKINSKALLLIDDEADNASINTNKKENDPTQTNKNIRKILGLFGRRGYVGYTATPFANIFIPKDADDLFPRDFIINLPSPKNYIGPEKVFGTSVNANESEDDVLPIVTKIDDYAEFVPTKHKKDDPKPVYGQMPESLKLAIRCFILTCAIRIARGQGNMHNSMLIHVSRFKDWQNAIKDIVNTQFNYYKNEIESEDPLTLRVFQRDFEQDRPDYLSYTSITKHIMNSDLGEVDAKMKVHSWKEIKPLLYKAVQKIEVKAINGPSGDILDYYENEKNGISVIAIGGDKLSRGLTLEGLSVSYFLRASKMYDTLMQMGRWFGYRPGYVDLCRLFTSAELNDWYRHITVASEELRSEFSYLAESHSTPDQFALRVRTHPGNLQITSVNKMRYATDLELSWAGRLIETYQLPMDKKKKNKNFIATEDFLDSIGIKHDPISMHKDNYLWRDVSPDTVCDYLSRFHVAPSLKTIDMALICEYIHKLNSFGELTSWNVVLMNKAKDAHSYAHFKKYGITVGCYDRTRSEEGNDDSYYFKKSHISGSRQDEFIDLDKETLNKALDRTKAKKAKEGKEWSFSYPSPAVVREEFRPSTTPLLIIYPINPSCANPRDKLGNITEEIFKTTDEPFVGVLISFPNSSSHQYVRYKANMLPDFMETEDSFDNENMIEYGND